MARDELDLPTLLAYQVKPTLILDSSGTVVAVNEGSVRLIFPHQRAISGNDGLLLGKSIADIGFALVPGGLPCRCTWESVLDAAFDARRPTRGILQNSNDCFRSNSVPDIYSKSTEFWDQEDERQSVIESNVHVTRKARVNSAVDTILSVEESSLISARATVRWYPSSKDGFFLITLSRTSLSQPSIPCPLFEASESKHTPQENVDRRLNPRCCIALQHVEAKPPDFGADLEGLVRFTSGMASSVLPYIWVVTDTDGQATSFSKSWYEFSGLKERESLGDGWLTVVHEEDVIGMTIAWSEVYKNKPLHWKHQARFRMASDGTYCWFLIRAQPCKDASGNVLRWYASMIDINQWVVARLQADRRQHSILTLFSQTDVMLWEIDKANRMYICEGRLKWDPTRVVELLTHNLQEQTAHTVDAKENEKHRGDGHLVRTIRTVLQGCAFSPVVEHWEGDRYFRTRFVAERCAPSNGGDEERHGVVEAAVALTFDITEEKARSMLQMENKRLISNEQAALDATNLKSRFLANMSHEIRTPVSGIIGLSEHLSDCGLTEEQMEFADNIRESAKFLLTLINNILDFSKMESGHMDMESIPFSLSKLVSDTITPLRFQAEEKGLALTLNCDLPPDALFLGDPWRVRQILTNLVGNSLKFTKQGQIDVSVCCLGRGCTETVTVQYIIHDSGVGISEEALKRLFKPFSQADNSTARIHGGSGLGLVICQQLIELMGGCINLQSTPGEGTIATCNIPFLPYYGSTNVLLMENILPRGALFSDNRERTTTCPQWSRDLTCKTSMEILARCPSPSVISATSGHVLLVEDNPINRKVIALAIKNLGYIVAVACDEQEALDYLCRQSVKPRPNAVLMDCMMPVVDGYEATRRIREDDGMFDEHVRTLPIIALTASAIKGDREKCKEAGMDDYLTKPAARGVLKRTLEMWIGLKRPLALDRSKSVC